MSEYQFRHDRAGYTGPLRVHIESTAAYGAAGAAGLGQGQGFADGIINLAGLLKAADGSDYLAAATPPGEGFTPPEHRLMVYRGNTAISSLTFTPVETAPGIVDINTLLSQGRAVAATPEQLLSLAAVAAELATQNDTYGQTLTAIQQALADTEQSKAALVAQFAGATFRTYPAGVYIGGVEVRSAWVDANDGVFAYFDAAGVVRFPAGVADLSLPTALISTLDIRALPSGYVTDAVHVLSSDSTGALALYVDSRGRVNAPGGIVSPSALPAGITTDSDGGVRVNGVLAVSKPALNFVGDSLTEGTGASSVPTKMPNRVSALLGGRAFTNSGMGGTNSLAIAARINAVRTFVTVTGGSIPATATAVGLTVSTNLLSGSGIRSMSVTIAGVPGTLYNPNNGSGYTFTRSVAGSAVAVPAGTLLEFDTTARAEDTQIIWSGRNDAGTMGADTVANVRAIVDRLPVGVKRFAVVSVINGAGEGSGTGSYTNITGVNALLRAAFPHNYVDVRSALTVGTGDDTTPASLRVDSVHLNDAGYEIVAQEIYKFLVWKGW